MSTLNVAFRDALAGVRLPTGGKVTLVVAPPPGEVILRLDLDPKEAGAADDRFVLSTKDGKYRQERTIKDDRVARDAFVDLCFTELRRTSTYTLEHDRGADGREKIFEDVPYAELVGLSRDAQGDPAQAETGSGELRVRLDVDPADARSRDDRFTLRSSDGAFSQTKTVKDDLTPGDAYVDLLFTGLPTSKDYALEVDLGKEAKPELVFADVPYGELAGMCWQPGPPDDAPSEETEGRLKVRLEIDPNEALSRDDRFTLFSTDGAFRVTKSTKDDLKAGDRFTDLLFTNLPTHLDYSLEVDQGREGGKELVFEAVPYAELAHMSWQLPPQDPEAEPEPATGELKVRLDIDPNDAASRDDRFVLFSTDRSFRQAKTVKDDRTPGDRKVDLLFTGLPRHLSYSLEVDLGYEGKPALVFEDVPYAELGALSWQLPPHDLDDEPASGHGDLRVRLDIDPEDTDIHDDRITLKATDGSFTQTRTVRDDVTPGDRWIDLVFTKLPKDREFTLEIDQGGGDVEAVFEDVPYAELAGLSWNVAQGAQD